MEQKGNDETRRKTCYSFCEKLKFISKKKKRKITDVRCAARKKEKR